MAVQNLLDDDDDFELTEEDLLMMEALEGVEDMEETEAIAVILRFRMGAETGVDEGQDSDSE